MRATPALVWLSWVATINALVLVFNLIPAFPLDGGGSPTPRSGGAPATATAPPTSPGARDRASRCCSALFGLWALATGGSAGLLTMLLAFLLYQAAGAAVAQGSIGQRIQNITVADIMDREPVTIPAALNLLDAQEQFFLRYRWPWFAVVDPARHFLGVVRGQRVDAEISRRAPRAGGRGRARAGPGGADRRAGAA